MIPQLATMGTTFARLAVVTLLITAPLAAQASSRNESVPPSVVSAVAPLTVAPARTPDVAPSQGPTTRSLAVGVRANVAQPAAPPAPLLPASSNRNPAMMIVGGAALIVGAVISGRAGTIVMIAGGAIGLVGLWNYLQ